MTLRKDGRLMARIYVQSGKYKYVYARNVEELEQKVKKAKKEVESLKRKTTLNRDMMLRDYITYYYSKISKVKESTLKIYSKYINIINNSKCGCKKLKDLTFEDFQSIVDLVDSNFAKNLIINILRTSFETIKKIGIIDYNYTILLREATNDQEQISENERKITHKYINLSNFSKIVKQSKDLTIKLAFWILYFTGVRISELKALTTSDFIDNFNILKITKQLNEHNKITTPKSKKAVRQIKVQDKLKQVLEEYTNKVGEFRFDGAFAFRLKRALKNASKVLNETFNFHDFRHSFATNSFIAERNPKAVQLELGHTSYELTINTYTHLPSLSEEEIKRVKELFVK